MTLNVTQFHGFMSIRTGSFFTGEGMTVPKYKRSNTYNCHLVACLPRRECNDI
jgi:hypothetical protein